MVLLNILDTDYIVRSITTDTSSLTLLVTSVSSCYASQWITSWSIQKHMHFMCTGMCLHGDMKLHTAKRQNTHFYIPRTNNCEPLYNVDPTICGTYVLVLIEFNWPTLRMVVFNYQTRVGSF